MWQPKNLKINRLASHLNTEYEFKAGKARLIQGINKDDDSQESNGSGKSIIPEAVIIALTGEPFRKARVSEMIRDGKDNCEVELLLYNTKYKKELVIWRKFYIKKSQEIKIYVGEKEEKHSSVTEYEKRIFELIGISKDDLINYFIVHKDKYTPFFISSDGDKKQIISRFSGANLLDGIDDLVKNDLEESNNLLIAVEGEKLKFEGKTEAYKEELDELKAKDFEAEKEEQINVIKRSIVDKQNWILKWIEGVFRREKNIESYTLELNKLEISTKYEDLIKEIGIEITNLDKLKDLVRNKEKSKIIQIEKLKKELSLLTVKLIDKIICPKCSHEFSFKDEKFDIKKAEKEVKILSGKADEIRVELKEIGEDIGEINSKLDEEENKKDEYRGKMYKLNSQRKEIAYKISNSKIEIKSIKSMEEMGREDIKQMDKQIEEIKQRKIEDKVTEINNKIKKCEKAIVELNKDIEAVEKDKFKIEQWVYNFKRFGGWLANIAVKSIEGFTNYYLEKTHSNLQVLMEGYKTLADGKSIREQIDTLILKNGINQGNFGRYSSGERARISICSILAMQKLINLNSESGGMDLLYLDEIIESIDGEGVRDVMKALNELGQTIEVITHARNEINNIETLTWVKEYGNSKILKENLEN